MNIFIKRFLMLAVCAAALLFLSCGSDDGGSGGGAPDSGLSPVGDNITGDDLPEDAAGVTDDVPVYNFNGAEFRIASVDNANFSNIYVVHEEEGEILNDSIYKRTLYIEERFNVSLTEFFVWDGDVPSRFNRDVRSGDSSFHIFNMRCDHALPIWIEGNLIPWNEIPNIDLSKTYWDQSINSFLTINNFQPMSIGSFNIGTYDLAYALLFNKQLIADLGLEMPYNLVESGEWTFDAMNTMMKAFTQDVNGDGIMDRNDNFGYVAHHKMVVPNFYIAAGEMSIKKDAGDIPYLAVGEPRFLGVWEKVYQMMYDDMNWYRDRSPDADVPSSSVTAFQENRALFMDTSFFEIERLRGMETDFGIIPYPKFDRSQSQYYARISYYIPTVVPVSNNELEMTGAIFEVLNAESHRTVLPTYLDTILRVRNTRDEESAAMLDLMFDSFVVDIGDTTMCAIIRDGFIATMFNANNRDFASAIERQSARIERELDRMINIER
jgi:hypothetical protein